MKKVLISLACALLMLTSTVVRSQTFTNYNDSLSGLANNYVCGGVAIDGNNNKWFGTATGVSKFDDVTWTTYTTTNGLIDNYIKCITVDTANNVWVGTMSGVSKFNGSIWTNYTTTDGLVDNDVSYIYADKSGSVWFATSYGLSQFDGSSWSSYTTTDGLSSDVIKYISEDAAGNIWICTELGGYSKFDLTNFTNFTIATMDSLASDITFAVAVDASFTQWVGTWSGISKINSSGVWVDNIRYSDGVYNNFIRDLKIGTDGDLWVACFADYNGDGGISRYNGTTWASWSTPEGLADKQVIRLALDNFDNVWVATGNGVSKMSASYSIGDVKDQSTLQISPNPASDVVCVKTEVAADIIRILDMKGQLLIEKIPASNQETISIDELSAGLYVLQCVFNDHVSSIKLVVK